MSTFKFKDMLEADAYLSLSYEYVGTINFGPTPPVIVGPFDYSESGGYWDIILTGTGLKTIIYIVNLGHIMPMEWSVERNTYDASDDSLLSTTTITFTLVASATFTFDYAAAGTYDTYDMNPPVVAPA